MTDPGRILEVAKTILLVDWPNPGVPRALLEAGFTVYSFCPGRYSAAELVSDRPPGMDDKDIFPPVNEGSGGCLVFRELDGRPESVDIVNVYRPAEELAGIVANQVLPLGAKVLWLQPPVTSAEAPSIAKEYGLVVIEGQDIAEIAGRLRGGEQAGGERLLVTSSG